MNFQTICLLAAGVTVAAVAIYKAVKTEDEPAVVSTEQADAMARSAEAMQTTADNLKNRMDDHIAYKSSVIQKRMDELAAQIAHGETFLRNFNPGTIH